MCIRDSCCPAPGDGLVAGGAVSAGGAVPAVGSAAVLAVAAGGCPMVLGSTASELFTHFCGVSRTTGKQSAAGHNSEPSKDCEEVLDPICERKSGAV